MNYELAEATAAKSRFLASMSHDLRTPLNAIIGFSEVQIELFGPLNDKQKEYLDDVVSSGKLQLQLVNEILDLSKIESGKMELDGRLRLGLIARRSRLDVHGETAAPKP